MWISLQAHGTPSTGQLPFLEFKGEAVFDNHCVVVY